ncbi:hypothetical protein KR51_00030830 [Rubidibacter lacunae KORDI 51-2]|uniref:Uncharacterized protein n=1 Tax=Rubidibacter lacunae KORDI 51-2 TaxID=582515 RepID=U5DLE4_9CHRO|nr:hypothetical protein KR51_00030830 [Rubidibacter lacunae KORDI 51-2]
MRVPFAPTNFSDTLYPTDFLSELPLMLGRFTAIGLSTQNGHPSWMPAYAAQLGAAIASIFSGQMGLGILTPIGCEEVKRDRRGNQINPEKARYSGRSRQELIPM